jgi:hypothetical protein
MLASKRNKLKNLGEKLFFVGVLKVTDEKKQDPDPQPDPYQNVTDSEHCFQG